MMIKLVPGCVQSRPQVSPPCLFYCTRRMLHREFRYHIQHQGPLIQVPAHLKVIPTNKIYHQQHKFPGCTYKDMRVKVWCRYHNIIVDRLRSIGIRLCIKLEFISVLVNSGPELTSVNAEHDISDSFGHNYFLIDEMVDQVLSERNALLHIRLLHFKYYNNSK